MEILAYFPLCKGQDSRAALAFAEQLRKVGMERTALSRLGKAAKCIDSFHVHLLQTKWLYSMTSKLPPCLLPALLLQS